jgi:hypothetical protein
MIGIVATLGSSQTLTYTVPSNCKMIITAGAQSTNVYITLNGTNLFYFATVGGTGVSATDTLVATQEVYFAANQTMVLVTASNTTAIVSAYEE